jgi:carbonic anhydrase
MNQTMPTIDSTQLSHADALARLRAGNERFIANVRSIDSLSSQARRDALVSGQKPYAIVLSCSDSRAPAEHVFDCGLGELFSVRVAGNIAAPSIIGSVEFAASTFGTQLVVVMGHTQCGAVKAALDMVTKGGAPESQNVRDIVERITPSIAELASGRKNFDEELTLSATRSNVRATASHLRHGSRVLEQLIAEDKLRVVGGCYELESGRVDFFDGV